MPHAGKVSVIIPTYNRAAYIAETLDSILGQTCPPWQVIVVNDGSTDDTRTVLSPYMERILYLEKENGGKSSALNTAMHRVSGDYVWIFDDDDVAFPDALARHMETLTADESIGFTYSSYIVSSTAEDGRIRPIKDANTPNVPDDTFFTRLLELNFISHPSVVARKRCYDEVGYYNESLVRSQDYEMLIRLARRFRAAMVPGATYCRRYHEGSRGSAADPFEPKKYEDKAFFYERLIFSRLREVLTLEEFLPKGTPLTAGSMRQALLQRAAVMAIRGLWDDALVDLLRVTAGQSGSRGLTKAEKQRLWKCMSRPLGVAQLLQDADTMQKLAATCRGPLGLDVRRELARGIFYMIRAEPSLRLRSRVRYYNLAWRLLSISGVYYSIVEKLRLSSGAA